MVTASGHTAIDGSINTEPRAHPESRDRSAIRSLRVLIVLAAPTGVQVAIDLWHRGPRIAAFDGSDRVDYGLAVATSLIVSSLLVLAAADRRRWRSRGIAALFLLEFTLALGGQNYFFQQYHAYLNQDVSEFASNLMDSVFNQLWADLSNYLLGAMLPALGCAVLLLWLGRRYLRPRRTLARWSSWLAPAALVGAMFVPTQHRREQACTPDILYLNAIGGFVRTQLGLTDQSHQLRPRVRESLPVPPLVAHPSRPRNVLLIQLESVRADATCIGYDPNCRRTEATNRLFPDRFPLFQLRSVSSCTAISSAALWGGLLPTESRDVLHTWPLIFDYARQAGYRTAYFTSQNMMFGNARLWVKNLGVDRSFTATEIDPSCDLDMGAREELLVPRLISEFDQLGEPFFAVLQLSNVHYPYYVDPNRPQPFQPAALTKAPERLQEFFNYYQNSVYQQDIHLARFLRHLRQSPAGARTVIVYTSDHAEAFREHGNMGHTFSVLDNEIHVPGWIDAPPGTLTADEARWLKERRNVPVTHLDVAMTLVDLLGLLDNQKIQHYLKRLPGKSLLRSGSFDQMIPLTNCAGVWSCAFENWGVLQGTREVEAREWEGGQWHCWDHHLDPTEETEVDLRECADLIGFALKTFGRRPGKQSD